LSRSERIFRFGRQASGAGEFTVIDPLAQHELVLVRDIRVDEIAEEAALDPAMQRSRRRRFAPVSSERAGEAAPRGPGSSCRSGGTASSASNSPGIIGGNISASALAPAADLSGKGRVRWF
jgi:hypothetical protein